MFNKPSGCVGEGPEIGRALTGSLEEGDRQFLNRLHTLTLSSSELFDREQVQAAKGQKLHECSGHCLELCSNAKLFTSVVSFLELIL